MKILFLLTQDLESPSGLGRYWPLAKSLADLGHKISIAALHSNWDSLKQRKFILDGVSIEYVAPMHVRKSGTQKHYYSPLKLLYVSLIATLALTKAAVQSSHEIIYICKPHPMNSLAAIFASKIKKSTLCLDCDDYEAGSNRFMRDWQKKLVAFFEHRVPKWVQFISTNTNYMFSNLINWGIPPDKIFYLPNGVDRKRFNGKEASETIQLRTNLGINGMQIVLYLGSLSLTNHAVNILLQAFKKVSLDEPDAKLLIVGGGEDFQTLTTMAKELDISQKTYFTGRIDSSDVAKYYALADVAVDPVNDDPASRGRSPLKLFESWICGVPFVTSPVGDRAMLLADPPAGILVNPADPDALADGILMVLKSKTLAGNLRQNGLIKIQNYTWNSLAENLEKELKKL